MRTIVAAGLVALTLCIGSQAVEAKNPAKFGGGVTEQHHSGASTGLLIGDYRTECNGSSQGTALADTRNISISNAHNQQVVHLQAQGTSEADAFLVNLSSQSQHTQTVEILTPITFTVVKGNARLLGVTVGFIPHGSTSQQIVTFVTSNSKLTGDFLLVSNGNGNYSVPLGDGLPQGATLTGLEFSEVGNQVDCTKVVSDISHVSVNNRFIGIDGTAAAAFCGSDCEGGGGDS
jgi:hypothetical protein